MKPVQKLSSFNLTLVWVMIVLLAVFLLLSYVQFASAEPVHIGIEFSETCILLIELGDLETCGNPELIQAAYPQSPLNPNYQKMFDDMAKNDKTPYQKNAIYANHVKSCVYENYCDAFDTYSSVYYWYDLDKQTRNYFDKIITINANMKHTNLNAPTKEVFVNDTTRSLILDTNQIHVRSCSKISYTPVDYRMLQELGSIVWFVSDGCDDIEKLGVLSEPYIETLVKTEYDPRDSPNWIYLQELEALKTKYKENRIGKD